jgi:hypothetical protein
MEHASTPLIQRTLTFSGIEIILSANEVNALINKNRLPTYCKLTLIQASIKALACSQSMQEKEQVLDALAHYIQCKGALVSKKTFEELGSSLGIVLGFIGSWFFIKYLLQTFVILLPHTTPILLGVCVGIGLGVCLSMAFAGLLGSVLLVGVAWLINVRSQLEKTEETLITLITPLLQAQAEKNKYIDMQGSETSSVAEDGFNHDMFSQVISHNRFFQAENGNPSQQEVERAAESMLYCYRRL